MVSWFNFAGKLAINACDRLCIGDKMFTYAVAFPQAMPAATSQVGRRHMRTRLKSEEKEAEIRDPCNIAPKDTLLNKRIIKFPYYNDLFTILRISRQNPEKSN